VDLNAPVFDQFARFLNGGPLPHIDESAARDWQRAHILRCINFKSRQNGRNRFH
jgi:hypothetical protein